MVRVPSTERPGFRSPHSRTSARPGNGSVTAVLSSGPQSGLPFIGNGPSASENTPFRLEMSLRGIQLRAPGLIPVDPGCCSGFTRFERVLGKFGKGHLSRIPFLTCRATRDNDPPSPESACEMFRLCPFSGCLLFEGKKSGSLSRCRRCRMAKKSTAGSKPLTRAICATGRHEWLALQV